MGLVMVAANVPAVIITNKTFPNIKFERFQCLTLYWATSSVFGLVQNVVIISPKVRRFCRIPQTPSELENPYQQVISGFKHKWGLKQSTSKES